MNIREYVVRPGRQKLTGGQYMHNINKQLSTVISTLKKKNMCSHLKDGVNHIKGMKDAMKQIHLCQGVLKWSQEAMKEVSLMHIPK